MRPAVPPPIPVLTTSCWQYERILMAGHVLIIPEGEPPDVKFFTTRQCLLQKQDSCAGMDLLLKMVGG